MENGNVLTHINWIHGLQWLVSSLPLSVSRLLPFCASDFILSADWNMALCDSYCLEMRKDGTSSSTWVGIFQRKNLLAPAGSHVHPLNRLLWSRGEILWFPLLGSSPHPCGQYYANKQTGIEPVRKLWGECQPSEFVCTVLIKWPWGRIEWLHNQIFRAQAQRPSALQHSPSWRSHQGVPGLFVPHSYQCSLAQE